MEQELIINRNLIYYYENISLFINFFKQIYYKNRLFFQGTFDNKTRRLEVGKLYDLANDSKTLIYDGKFVNGLPSGVGKTNSHSYICYQKNYKRSKYDFKRRTRPFNIG